MGMFDGILGGMIGAGMAGVVSDVLERHGGVQGVINQFQTNGLGPTVQSWVGTGPNQPVSPEQLQSVFGHSQVQGMANQAGMAPQDFLSQLSQHLPAAVNGMTPNGQLPEEGSVSV